MTERSTEITWLNELLSGSAFIDVRAPGEFEQGHAPHAINLPILDNQERRNVGSTYKHQGPEAALALGHSLVSGENRALKIESWLKHLRLEPGAWIYCFRGGQRSQLAQAWIQDAGISVRRVERGYKAMRRFFVETLANLPGHHTFRVLSGHTGSGKTALLKRVNELWPGQALDLEKLAKHRGSAFGMQRDDQPSQANFENQIAFELLRTPHFYKSIWFEDESRMIGRTVIPATVFLRLSQAPLYVIDELLDLRAQRILQEYVIETYQAQHPLEHSMRWDGLSQTLSLPLGKIRTRLGGARHSEAQGLLNDALAFGSDSPDWARFLPWIKFLLREYYDPFYNYHLDKNSSRIAWRGPRNEALGLIQTMN